MLDLSPDPELYPFASRWLESRVGRVHYVDEGEGRPILFLHGNPTWSFLYRNIVRGLRDRFRCVAIDYPGFGLSVRPPNYGYTPAEHAVVVRELILELELDDLIVMGQDWGGPIGLSAAVTEPDRVSGLIFGNTWFWPTDRLLVKLFGRAMASPPLRWAILHRNLFVERMIPWGTTSDLDRRVMDHYRAAQPSPEARLGVAEFPRQLVAAGPWLSALAKSVPRILGDRPMLLVWGMRDPAFSPDHFLPRWQRSFADVRLVPLERAAHFIQEDAPERICEAIAERFGG
ncbi:MAG: alpha/beta fold hydrolase [Gemmatimonadota bacterium]|nr:alpha/beta fold hydrolase [Gemmatimonadota bacterium]